MIEDINYNTDIYSLKNIEDKKLNSSPSFKGGSGSVDTTPQADTYESTAQENIPETTSPLAKAAYIIPTWYVLNKGTNLFNKACGGEYEKSLVGRLGTFGDKVSESKLVRNGFVDKLKAYSNSVKKNIQNYIDKHPILSAMDKTPTKPENVMVKGFMETQAEADIKEASGKLKEFVEKSPKTLKEAGASKDEINTLKKKFGTDIFGRIKNPKAAIQEFQLNKLGGTGTAAAVANREAVLERQLQRFETTLKNLGANDPKRTAIKERIKSIKELKDNYRTNTLKNLKLKKLELSRAEFDTIQKEPLKNVTKIEQALDKGKSAFPKLSENFNKLKSIKTPKSALGKLFPKLAKLGMRGLTFGGGTFNTLFVAFFLADAVKNTVDAPKEQKAGTFAAGLLDALSWVVAMPLALGAMHKVSGMGNTGLSKEKYAEFRENQKIFNKDVKAGKYTNLEDYTAERTRIENLKRVSGNESKLTKIAKKFGNFIGIGLEQFEPYRESTKKLKGSAKIAATLRNLGRKMPNFLKNCAGYPLRFALYMFVFSPIVEKLFSGVTSAIFGKPYDPEKIAEEKKKEEERRAELYPGPAITPNPEAAQNAGKRDLNLLSNKNLIKQYILGVKPEQKIDLSQSNQPFLPPNNSYNNNTSSNEYNPNKSDYDIIPRSYVPQIDFNNPFPYTDPMTNPNAEKNYDAAQKLCDRSDKLAEETETFLNEK